MNNTKESWEEIFDEKFGRELLIKGGSNLKTLYVKDTFRQLLLSTAEELKAGIEKNKYDIDEMSYVVDTSDVHSLVTQIMR